MLLLVPVIGMPLGWLGRELVVARRQRVAVTMLWELGCYIIYAPDEPSALPKKPKKLAADGELRIVTGVNAENSQLTDAGLAYFWGLPQLTDLYLAKRPVTDTGLVHLRGLTQLTSLVLDHTQISDAGLARLQGLRQLERLYLDGTQISDDGLVHLKGLRNLKRS